MIPSMGNSGRPDGSEDHSTTRSKVHRVLRDYDLEGVGDELERRWKGEGSQRLSLRELADHLNKRILQEKMEQANEMTLDGEVENLYRLLVEDDVPARDHARVERKLSHVGIDVESLRKDFVSHQAVHSYLTDVRGVNLASRQASSSTILDRRKEAIQKLRNRLVAMTQENVRNLRETDRLSIGTFEVTATVTIHCQECGKSFDVPELFTEGRCGC